MEGWPAPGACTLGAVPAETQVVAGACNRSTAPDKVVATALQDEKTTTTAFEVEACDDEEPFTPVVLGSGSSDTP